MVRCGVVRCGVFGCGVVVDTTTARGGSGASSPRRLTSGIVPTVVVGAAVGAGTVRGGATVAGAAAELRPAVRACGMVVAGTLVSATRGATAWFGDAIAARRIVADCHVPVFSTARISAFFTDTEAGVVPVTRTSDPLDGGIR